MWTHIRQRPFFIILFNSYIWIFHQNPSKIKAFMHHAPCCLTSLPGRPHGTNASLIIGSEQLPLYSKKARNVYLFVRVNTNQIKSKIVCSLSNNGLIKLTHLSYPFKKYPASCSKEKHSSFIMLFFTFFSNDSLYVFFNSIHPSISNTSCSYL